MWIITAAASALTFGLAIVVLGANPRRSVNRAFTFVLTIIGAWLICVAFAMYEGQLYSRSEPSSLIFWLRFNAAVLSFLPVSVAVLTATLLPPTQDATMRYPVILFFLLGLTGVYLTTTPSFAYEARPGLLLRGFTYYSLCGTGIVAYLICLVVMLRQLRSTTGIRRLELQLLMLYSAGSGLFLTLLNVVGNSFRIFALKKAAIVILFTASLLLVWLLIFRRVFNAREIITRLTRDTLVIAGSGATLGVIWVLSAPLGAARIIPVVLVAPPLTLWLHSLAQTWCYGTAAHRTRTLRKRIVEYGTSQLTPAVLNSKLSALLAAEFGTPRVLLVHSDDKQEMSSDPGSPQLPPRLLSDIGWATPESLERMRPSEALLEVQRYLRAMDASLVAAVPRGSPAPSLFAIFSAKTNNAPFTYPEILEIFNLLELIDNILTRSRLTEQAALQARMEHLAMMSRGLAHDLKNLITPVSSFLIHTEGKYTSDSPEAEVHAAARRSVRIMTDYVREALFFSERLAPKFELVALPRTLSAVVEITASRACRRGVNVATDCAPGLAAVADNVLLQRMLANFVSNAIDASPAGATVRLSASAATPASERVLLQITDHGCGIAPEHLPRIFDAYFTTKEFGDEIRGFGLGLTIARKIADLHSATIIVKSRLGEGTTITVDLPARQAIALSAPAPHCVIADTAAS